MRKRCLVLRQIEHLQGKATLDVLCSCLSELTRDSIMKAVNNLAAQDRIIKGYKTQKTDSNRPQYQWRVNEDWEPAAEKRRGLVKGRKNHTEALQTNTTKSLGTVRYRDRKIKMLLGLMDHVNGTSRDLMIGLLADLGHTYKEQI